MADFHVRANWDPDAQVWWADSDELSGMVSEAATYEQLVTNIRELAADLIPLNHPDATSSKPDSPGVHRIIVSQEVETVAYAA